MTRHGSAAAERHPIASSNRRGRIAYGLRRQHGLSVIGWLLAIPAALIVLLILVIGFYEGRKAYWDAQVREMCAKDGGVTIFERVRVSKADIDRRVLPIAGGMLSVAIKELAHPEAPVYGLERITRLHEAGNLRVSRIEVLVIRRTDQAVVAKEVSYGRFGGDLPTGLAHDSSYGCPDLKANAASLAKLFIVEGASK